MFTKTEKIIVILLLGASLVAGVVGYSMTGKTAPRAKMHFITTGGDVVFDHAFHQSLPGECADCHHNLTGPPATRAESSCTACHYYGEAREVETAAPHPRGIGASCLECHQKLGGQMSDCEACHIQTGLAFETTSRILTPLPQSVGFSVDAANLLGEKRDKAFFNHDFHAASFACDACHHDYDPQKVGAAPRLKDCRECHYSDAMANERNPLSRHHKRFIGSGCVECHQEMAGANMQRCGACHQASDSETGFLASSRRKAIPNRITMEMESEKGKSRGKVTFFHAFHTGITTCDACHHPLGAGNDGMNPGDEKNCRSCHYSEEMADMQGADRTHPRSVGGTCRSCHAQLGEQARKCSTCHEKPDREPRSFPSEMNPPPKTISFEMASAEGMERGAVRFNHKKHFEKEISGSCVQCHHEVEKMPAGAEDSRNCRSCHYSAAMSGAQSPHRLHPRFVGGACMDCHAESPNAELRQCRTCHIEPARLLAAPELQSGGTK